MDGDVVAASVRDNIKTVVRVYRDLSERIES